MGSGNNPVHPNGAMPAPTPYLWERRDFVKGFAALADAAGLSAYDMRSAAAEPPLEVAKIRLTNTPAICLAPQYIAEELLKAEGFTDIQYVKADSTSQALASGAADISMTPLRSFVSRADLGTPLVMLAGVHLGCYELFGTERVRSIRDLKGKSVPVFPIGGPEHLFLSSMAA